MGEHAASPPAFRAPTLRPALLAMQAADTDTDRFYVVLCDDAAAVVEGSQVGGLEIDRGERCVDITDIWSP